MKDMKFFRIAMLLLAVSFVIVFLNEILLVVLVSIEHNVFLYTSIANDFYEAQYVAPFLAAIGGGIFLWLMEKRSLFRTGKMLAGSILLIVSLPVFFAANYIDQYMLSQHVLFNTTNVAFGFPFPIGSIMVFLTLTLGVLLVGFSAMKTPGKILVSSLMATRLVALSAALVMWSLYQSFPQPLFPPSPLYYLAAYSTDYLALGSFLAAVAFLLSPKASYPPENFETVPADNLDDYPVDENKVVVVEK